MTYFRDITRKKDKCLEKEIIQGTTPVYHTGCPRKGQTENELVGQYQTLDGADNGRTEDRLRTANGGRLLTRSTLEDD